MIFLKVVALILSCTECACPDVYVNEGYYAEREKYYHLIYSI